MTATVRSVRVVLNADIARYVADMKIAGRVTKDAFNGAGKGTAQLKRDLADVEKSTTKAGTAAKKTGQDFDGMGTRARGAGREIDRMSGRVRLLGEGLFTLGPALIPLTAGVLPALTGIGAAAGAAAGGVGVMALAFVGIGDALGALNDYQLEPTKAHLQALNEEMSKVGKSGQQFVRFLDSLGDEMRGLQFIARDNMLPGFEEGITSSLKLLPTARNQVAALSAAVGALAAEAGAALSGDRWKGFIDYIGTDAVPTLTALSHTVGNVLLGFANLMVAFAPASRDFTTGMENASRAFADWSANVGQTEGFQRFLDYVRSEGPQVVDLIEALGTMLLGVAHAAAPLGNAVLPVLTELAKIIGVIGNSPLGPVLYGTAAGMIAISRATKIAEAGMARFQRTTATTRGGMVGLAKTAGGVAAVAASVALLGDALADASGAKLSVSDLDRNLTAISEGGGSETLKRLATDFDNLHSSALELGSPKTFDWARRAANVFGVDSPLQNASKNIDAVDQALAGLVESGNADKAKEIFDTIVQSITGGSVAGGSVAPDLMKKINDQFNSYSTAVDNATAANGPYTASTAAAGEASQLTAAQIDGLVQSMRDQRSAALEAFDAETQWRQAMKDAAEQAKKNNAGIKGSSDAALANRDALSQLAAAWNNQSDAVKNNRARFREAKSTFIETATAMGVPEEAARRLARRILEIPKSRVAKISADTGQAESALASVRAQMAALRGKTVFINIIQRSFDEKRAGIPSIARANGGTVPGPREPYGDKMTIRAAPGEEIITNRHGEADRFRADRAAGRIPAYASGGTVGGGVERTTWRNDNVTDIRDFLHGIKLSTASLKQLERASERAGKTIEKEKQKREDLIGQRDSLAGQVAGTFNNDPFGNGLAGFDTQVAADTNDATAMRKALQAAAKRGLSGPLLAALGASGDLATAQEFAHLSPAEIALRERRFQTRTSAQNALGGFVANNEFGAQIAKYDKSIARLERTQDRLDKTLKTLKHDVRAGAHDGTKDGMAGKNRETAQRTRAGR